MNQNWNNLELMCAKLSEKKNTGKLVAMTLSSCIDYLICWDSAKINSWYKQYTIDSSLDYSKGIANAEELLKLINDMIITGNGGDFLITSKELCREIEEKFEIEYAIGGTGAQGACALANMGFPVALHTTVFSDVMKKLINNDLVLVEKDGKLQSIITERLGYDNDYAPHFILQFNRGIEIVVNDDVHRAENSNRLILTYDHKNSITPLDEEYFKVLVQNASKVSSMVLSGFNTIIRKEILQQRLESVNLWIDKIKQENPEIVFYLEGASYHSAAIIPYIYATLSPKVNILGFNEEELGDILRINGKKYDLDDLFDLVMSLRFIIDLYKPKYGIVLHTKDYSLYFGKRCEKDIEAGLHFGNLMAGIKARLGRYGKLDDLRGYDLTIPFSPEGLKMMNFAEKYEGTEQLVVAPNRFLKNPTSTIGLGDTFTAGMQLGFI
ncbi:MAG TPA: hypothetical protein DDW65_17360 [Firmicutes bacterium]|jgi:ADP-dependent phosphofructokinase/glucokinase|nr:hypothetical protein [Bacillota bacterium]